MNMIFTKIERFVFIMTLVMLTLAACSNDTMSSYSVTSSSTSETIPSPSNHISSSTPLLGTSSSGVLSDEASLSSNSQSDKSQQQSSVSVQEESNISIEVADLEDFTKDETHNMHSKIISCSIENGAMTVIFSAFSENPINVNAFMDVWMSDDNSAGQVYETYSIDKLKEYSMSVSSSYFEENESEITYAITIYIETTTHSFYFRDGKMWA